jgi:hypothetical protein
MEYIKEIEGEDGGKKRQVKRHEKDMEWERDKLRSVTCRRSIS